MLPKPGTPRVERSETRGSSHKNNLPDTCCHLIHAKEQEKALKFWSSNLNLPASKFKIIDDKIKNSAYGVCHIYLSDVLLRRVIDEINRIIIN